MLTVTKTIHWQRQRQIQTQIQSASKSRCVVSFLISWVFRIWNMSFLHQNCYTFFPPKICPPIFFNKIISIELSKKICLLKYFQHDLSTNLFPPKNLIQPIFCLLIRTVILCLILTNFLDEYVWPILYIYMFCICICLCIYILDIIIWDQSDIRGRKNKASFELGDMYLECTLSFCQWMNQRNPVHILILVLLLYTPLHL